MIDVSTIARANAISVEAKLVRHSKRADGGINIGLAIHPHGMPQALIDAQLGDRFMVALVQIDEHEQPVQQPKEDAPKHTSEPAPALPQTPARARNRYAMRAGILSNDPLFQRYLNEEAPLGYGPCTDANDAAEIIRKVCGVKSRADILHGTPAVIGLDLLESSFVVWRDKDSFVEAS